MKHYSHLQGFTPLLVLIYGTAIILAGFSGVLGYKVYRLQVNKDVVNNAVVTPVPTPYNTPTTEPVVYATQKPVVKTINNDPIVACNINSNCGGGTKQMKNSDCTKSICCQIANGSWILTDKDSCNKAQTNNYPACTIYYPSLGYSKTYTNTSPSDCEYWKQRAIQGSQPLNLPEIKAGTLPTFAPYVPTYTVPPDPYGTWTPTQFVAPTPICYSTWEQYFNAHPNYAPQNITQMSGTPPCD